MVNSDNIDNNQEEKIMAEDVPILFLPNEITELILEDPRLSIQDVVNFGTSCRHFQRIVFGDNKLWRIKFFQR